MYWMSVGRNRFKYGNGLFFLSKCVDSGEDGSPKSKLIYTKHIDKLWKSFIFIFSTLYLSYTGIMFGPIYAYFYQNVRTTPMGIHLPFFERDSDAEFFASMSLQGVASLYVILGNFMAELATCATNCTMGLVPDIIRFNLGEFNDDYVVNRKCMGSTAQLRNVLMLIEDFIK